MSKTMRLTVSLLALLTLGGVAAAQERYEERGDKSQGEEEEIRRRQEWFRLAHGLDTVERPDLRRAQAVRDMQRGQELKQRQLELAGETWISLGPESMTMFDWAMGRVSGHVTALAVHPTNESILYLAGETGGVWKTTNGGGSWAPLFDAVGTMSVGALALDRTNSNILWVGTGARQGQCESYFGLGLYRSTDGGAHFEPRNGSGTNTLRLSFVSSIAQDPVNPQTLLVSGEGFCTGGTFTSGGVFRSTDGGGSWIRVLGARGSDVVYDPTQPAVAYAALNDFGVYKSTDGGLTWAPANSGITTAGMMRIRLAMSPGSSQRLYALVAHREGGREFARLYRTSDGAGGWELVNGDACEGQCDWNLCLDVHPTDSNRLLVGSIRVALSTNGGVTLTPLTATWGSAQRVHQDTHVVRFSKSTAGRFWVGSDGGLWRGENGGSTFVNLNANLSLTQFYDVALDPDDPGRVFGGSQDNSSSGRFGSQRWDVTALTGDGFMNLVNPNDPQQVFQTSYPTGSGPYILRSTSGGQPHTFFRLGSSGLVPGEPYWWVTPLALLDGSLFVGSNSVYRAVASQPESSFTWTKVSPDLAGAIYQSLTVITATPSRVTYAGTTNGRIHRTDDVLAPSVQWSDVTGNYPGGFVSDLAADATDSRRVFATRAAFGPSQLYRSTTGGGSWTAVGSGLPNVPANAVAVDPLLPQRVFVGTDVGVYESVDGGNSFTPFSAGLPLGLVVTDLEIDDAPHVLLAGTYGRGAYRVTLTNPPPATVALTAAAIGVGEEAGTAVVQVRVTTPDGQPTALPIDLSHATADGTATTPADYTFSGGNVSFPAGTPSGSVRSLSVPVVDDALDEDNETFEVRITGTSVGAVVGAPAAATVTIADNDPLPTISTQDATLPAEGHAGSTPLTFHLGLSAPSGRTATVRFRTEDLPTTTARAGADYEAVDQTVSFAPGSTSAHVQVPIRGERLYEPGGPETFAVKLESPGNAVVAPPGGWLGRIVDDDTQPTVSIADCSRLEGRFQPPPCALAVTLSNPSTQTIAVSYTMQDVTATHDVDYQPGAGRLFFPPETTAAQYAVAYVLGDAQPEPRETFVVFLLDPSNATIADGTAEGTIMDDEAARFHALSPCRVLDTRLPPGTAGGPKVTCGQPRTFPVAGSCGIPATAQAVAFNVTVAQPSASGNLRLYPAGLALPGTSVLNFAAAETRSNNATALLGTAGQATVQCDVADSGDTHVVVDVFGYYEVVGVGPSLRSR